MDELVKLGLAKWPNVPDCFGWLALDARGRWRIGETRQPINHAPTVGFINRNYTSDGDGRWLFQNGPQRVYVDLEYTPYVFRLQPDAASVCLVDHVGTRTTRPDALWIDDGGQFLVQCAGRIGALHDHDGAQLLGYITDSDGGTLADGALGEAIEAAIGRTGEAADTGLSLCWPGAPALIGVASISRAEVPARFGFEPHPLAAKRRSDAV